MQDTTVEYYAYDGPNVLGSYASNGNLNARYVTPELDENLSVTRGANTYYYASDGLGSVRNVLDGSEAAQNTYDYYAFGDSLGTQTQGVTNPYRYTAREYESGSVLDTYYYRNRYYMSGLGIFASRDAIWADVARGWGYAANDPLDLTDPYGLGILSDLWDWVKGLFGGGKKKDPQSSTPTTPTTKPPQPQPATDCPPGDEVLGTLADIDSGTRAADSRKWKPGTPVHNASNLPSFPDLMKDPDFRAYLHDWKKDVTSGTGGQHNRDLTPDEKKQLVKDYLSHKDH